MKILTVILPIIISGVYYFVYHITLYTELSSIELSLLTIKSRVNILLSLFLLYFMTNIAVLYLTIDYGIKWGTLTLVLYFILMIIGFFVLVVLGYNNIINRKVYCIVKGKRYILHSRFDSNYFFAETDKSEIVILPTANIVSTHLFTLKGKGS